LTHRAELIAHRGASHERTENTLEACIRALELGADAIELDVHATADGVVVVHHDFVPRTNPPVGRRVISEFEHDELAALELSKGGRIPTLDDVLAEVNGRATMYVEVKAPGIEKAVADCIARSPSPCAVHSFDHRAVGNMRSLLPDVPRGILTTAYLMDPGAALASVEARDYWQHWELVDESLVDAVHEAGGRLIAWTVDDPEVARRFADWGVDGICTNAVAVIRDEIRGR
jgi:glycerophosphoryl diester phosphodiesterase